LLGAIATARGVGLKVARMFAFVGPYLPLDTHFAIGNFIRDALAGGPIVIGGDGTPIRSYMYAADMIIWLLKIFARGEVRRAYNVGSEDAVTIAALAEMIRIESGGQTRIEIRGRALPDQKPERYIPSTARARSELGLQTLTPLDQGIRRTIAWQRSAKYASA
jgi:dTDP-glucose 4,6-dehydratase